MPTIFRTFDSEPHEIGAFNCRAHCQNGRRL